MNYAAMIDHTILKPEAGTGDVRLLCEEAKEYGFASVCVNPGFVSAAYTILKDTPVKVCTVVGFPLGATTTLSKVTECVEAMKNGAEEIDMVLNIGRLIEGDTEYVYRDIKAVADAVKGYGLLKVILETCLLTDEQIVTACELCVKAGADFVKTSTGFSKGGATVSHVALMKKTVAGKALVKASGGVRNFEDAKKMVEAGADRIGTSNGIAIVQQAQEKQ